MARRSTGRTKSPPPKSGAPKPINLGWLGGTVGFHLRTAQEAAFQAFARRANGADARPWRFAVLALIDANSGLTQGELAAAIRRNTSSLTLGFEGIFFSEHHFGGSFSVLRRTS
jgi:hypothetical protein